MNFTSEKPFSSPEEEISWLEKRLEEKKREVGSSKEKSEYEMKKEILREAEELPPEAVSEAYRLSPSQVQSHSNALVNEPHHKQIDELIRIARERGIVNALQIVRSLHNPHLLDDFHDMLIAEELFSSH